MIPARIPARLALVTLLGLASACGGAATPTTSQEVLIVSPADLPAFARGDARLSVAHTGVRRLEYTPPTGAGLAFLERITTDGQGHYAIEPVGLLGTSELEWDGFEMLQRLREGFSFRYRDFQVRDPQAFLRNWHAELQPGTVLVAGRVCERYRLDREVGTSEAFELSVDATGLVLASRQLDASGQVLAAMTYESFQLDPDTSLAAWHEPSNSEEALDPHRDLAAQVDTRLLEPRLLPAGYGLLEAATVRESPEARWLKLVYSDGVEPLFFLQRVGASSSGKTARATHPDLGGAPASTSAVVVYRVGAALAIQGQVSGQDLMVIGKAVQAELLDLIESALP